MYGLSLYTSLSDLADTNCNFQEYSKFKIFKIRFAAGNMIILKLKSNPGADPEILLGGGANP